MSDTPPHLDQLASRVQALYSRPTVAMEIVRLAEQPRVDPRALKQCVEQDPALACKILRVVNSSVYGLSRPVTDLSQALQLLGIKPLQFLVLGFNLPDALFAEVASRELRWYWTNTLTRAVAARLLSEQLWHRPGDEAFTVGLLQDIGILVMIRELRTSYTHFLAGVIQEKRHLAALEQDTLGFDHTQLSAAVLARWRLPQRLVEAIATPKRMARLARMTPPDGDLPQILHLAELLAELVGQQRLTVLPDLLEAGKLYRGMTKLKLASLVESLQPQVDQLADVLALELTEKRDYVQVLLQAHRHMADLSEQLAGQPVAERDTDPPHGQLLEQSRELTVAMQNFLHNADARQQPGGERRQWQTGHAAHDRAPWQQEQQDADLHLRDESQRLLRLLNSAAKRCRELRCELSLLLVEPHTPATAVESLPMGTRREVREALVEACSSLDDANITLIPIGSASTAAVLTNCERRTAVAIAHRVIARLGAPAFMASGSEGGIGTTVCIGVATACAVPRNFDAVRLLESAERCLSAARGCGISTAKSIEV